MSKKSVWESSFWKAVGALSALVTIIVAVLQFFGKVDFYKQFILPISNFFTLPIPLYSVPLTLFVVLIIIIVWAYLGNLNTTLTSDPLAGAEILDNPFMRFTALLCQTPQSPEYLKKHYQEFLHRSGYNSPSFEDCIKVLEDKGLVLFQNGKWQITKKALDYLAKYHGE